jgi:hypothetical protein
MEKQRTHGQIGVRMTVEELNKLERLARASQRSRSAVLRVLLNTATTVPAVVPAPDVG